MADKIIFLTFALEDKRQRDFLKQQLLPTRTGFKFIDMSVKEPCNPAWKDDAVKKVRQSDGVLALVSNNSARSIGQQWEIACAQKEGNPLFGIWAYAEDRTGLQGVNTVVWSIKIVTAFIDSLLVTDA